MTTLTIFKVGNGGIGLNLFLNVFTVDKSCKLLFGIVEPFSVQTLNTGGKHTATIDVVTSTVEVAEAGICSKGFKQFTEKERALIDNLERGFKLSITVACDIDNNSLQVSINMDKHDGPALKRLINTYSLSIKTSVFAHTTNINRRSLYDNVGQVLYAPPKAISLNNHQYGTPYYERFRKKSRGRF